MNEGLQHNRRWHSVFVRMRDAAIKDNATKVAESTEKGSLVQKRQNQEDLVSEAPKMTKFTKAVTDNSDSVPASRLKLRDHWMHSLITSGAVKGWEYTLGNSSNGCHLQMTGFPKAFRVI